MKSIIKSLVSLRFFAIGLVILSHLVFLQYSSSTMLNRIYDNFLYEGYIGVTFFFILSGFILSYSYSGRFKNHSIKAKNFIFARIARIYPLHVLTFICSLPLASYNIVKNGHGFISLFLNLFLIQSFFPDVNIYFSANLPSWFLSDIMFFYILFPFLVTRRNKFLLVVASLSVLWQIFVANSGYTEIRRHYFVYIFPLSRMLDFVVGILLYRFARRLNGIKQKIPVNWLQLSSVLILFIFFFMKNNVNQVYRYDSYYVLPMAFIIFSFYFDKGVIANIISNKTLLLLGGASFSLYMTHQLIIRYVRVINLFFLRGGGFIVDITLALFCILVSILISILLHKFFENRAKDAMLSILKRTI